MFGPLKQDNGEFVVITRRLAADTGRTFFYTGKNCKHGHNDVRYVTTGACRACLRNQFKPKQNPWSKELITFSNANLWTAARFNKAQRTALRVYLQACIFAFVRAQLATIPFASQVNLEAAMQEIEERPRFTQLDDPRNTD